MAAGAVRILVWHGARGEGERLTRIYHEISQALAGTPGLLGNELLCSVSDPDSYVVMSVWESLEAFRRWDATPSHRHTARLREFRDVNGRGQAYDLYTVVAAHGNGEGGNGEGRAP